MSRDKKCWNQFAKGKTGEWHGRDLQNEQREFLLRRVMEADNLSMFKKLLHKFMDNGCIVRLQKVYAEMDPVTTLI